MRTTWEQARQEAFVAAVKRGESRLLGEDASASNPISNNPSLAAQAVALTAQVAEKVRELVPSATAGQISQVIASKVVPMLQNATLVETAPKPTLDMMGLSSKTKKALAIGVGALAGVGLLYFLLRKK